MAKDYSAAIERMKEKAKEVAATNAPSSVPSPPTPENKDYSAAIERMRRRREYEDKMAVVNAQRAQRQENRRQNIEGLQTRANEVKAKRLQERTQAVIKAELEAAKKKDGDAKLLSGEWWRDIGEEASAIFDYNKQKQITTDRTENAKRVEELTKELNERKAYDYNLLTQNKDFEAKSKYVANKDNFYGYINRDPEATERYISTATMEVPEVFREYFGMSEPQAEHMTEEEISLYNYIYATKGKDSADEYYEYLRPTLNARYTNQKDIETEEYGKLHPGKAAAKSVLTNVGGLTTSFVPTALDLFGQKIDPNDPIFRTKRDTEKLISGGAQTIKENYGGVTSFLYEQSVSMANNLTARAISYLSGNLMPATLQFALTTAQDKTLDAIERGVDQNTAIMMGLPAGIIEAACENLSLESFGNRFLNNVTSNKWWKDWIIQTFTEAGEELATSVATRITDTVIAMGESEFMLAVNQYKQAGMSDGQAIGRVLLDNMKEDALAALGGAISGFVFGGGGVAINKGVDALQNAGDKAAERDVAYRGQNTIRDMLNSDKYKDMRTEQQKVTVLPTAVEQERAKARENGEVFDIGYERPYTGYANTVADDELDARVNAAQTVTEKTGIRHGASEQDIADALEISRALGVEVEFFTQLSKATNTVVDGFYNAENGHIYVNVNAAKGKDAKMTIPIVISHEFTHSLEGTNEYNDLRDLVAKELKKRGDSIEAAAKRLNRIYEESGRGQSMKANEADVIANFVEKNVLGTKESINKIVGAKPNLGRRILAFLNRILAQFRRGSSAYTTVNQIRDQLDDALSSRAQEAPTAEGVEENVANESEKTAPSKNENEADTGEKVNVEDIGANLMEKHKKGTITDEEFDMLYESTERQIKGRERRAHNLDVKFASGQISEEEYVREAEKIPSRDDAVEIDLDKAKKNAEGYNRPKSKEPWMRYSISTTLESDLDAVLNHTFDAKNNEVYIGETSNFLTEVIGVDSMPVYMPAAKAYAAMVPREEWERTRYYKEQDHYHNLGKEKMIEILNASENPIAAFVATPDLDGNERNNRIVLVTDVKIDGQNAVVIEEIETTARTSGKQVRANKVITTYDRAMIADDIIDAYTEGRLLHFDKKRNQYLAGRRGSKPQATIRDTDFTNNIAQFWWNVNKRKSDVTQMQQLSFSVSETDSIPDDYKTFVNSIPRGDGNHLRGIVNKLASSMHKTLKLDMEQIRDGYRTEEYTSFVESVVEPMVMEYMKTGDISEKTVKAVFEANYNGTDKKKANDMKAFEKTVLSSISNLSAVRSAVLVNDAKERYTRNIIEEMADVVADEMEADSADEDVLGLEHLTPVAKRELRSVERSIANAAIKALGLDIETGVITDEDGKKHRSEKYLRFIREAVRPITNEYLRTGEVSEAIVNEIFEKKYDDAKVPNKKYSRAMFDRAIEYNVESLKIVRKVMRERKLHEERTDNPKEAFTSEKYEALKKDLDYARQNEEKVKKAPGNLLTEHDEMLIGDVLAGIAKPQSINIQADNKKGAMAVYEAKLATKEAAKAEKQFRTDARDKDRKLSHDLLGGAEGIQRWHEKGNSPKQIEKLAKKGIFEEKIPGGWAYARETFVRNIYDIAPNRETADRVIRELFYPIEQNEAANNKYSAQLIERVKKLNISQEVKEGDKFSEAYAVQYYGEAAYYVSVLEQMSDPDAQIGGGTLKDWRGGIDELFATSPGLDRAKIEKCAKEFRKIYDELYDKINDAYVRNGCRPLGKLEGYFPHFTKREDSFFTRLLRSSGVNVMRIDLPTSINGLTDTFKPGRKYFSHAEHRNGFRTDYDAIEGFESYLATAGKVIFHTDDIQRLRTFANEIRYLTGSDQVKAAMDEIYNNDTLDEEQKQRELGSIVFNGEYKLSKFVVWLDEYTNILAGKKSRYDRTMEDFFNRKAYLLAQAVKNRVGANMIAANASSMLTNFIPINQAGAILGPDYMLRGVWQTLMDLKHEGNIWDMSMFLINRRGHESLTQSRLRKWSDRASMPMSWIDAFAAASIIRASYARNLKYGLDESEAMYQADLFAASIMAGRSVGEMPTLFHAKNPLFQMFTQFQLEVNNEFSVLLKDIPSAERKRWSDATAIRYLLYFIGAALYNDLFEKLFGRRPALDPIGIVKETVEDVIEGADAYEAITGLGTNVAENLPFIGGLLGGGRLPVTNALPNFGKLLQAATDSDWSPKKKWITVATELFDPIMYLAPPFAGGVLRKIFQTTDAWIQGGRYTYSNAGEKMLQYPIYKENAKDFAANLFVGELFGPTSLSSGREWVEGGFGSLSVMKTAVYEALVDADVGQRKAFKLINDLSDVKSEKPETKTETIMYEGIKVEVEVPVDPDADIATKAELQRQLLRDSDISGRGKSIVYFGLMASDKELALMATLDNIDADMGAVTDVLMSFKDAGSTHDKLQSLLDANLTDRDKRLLYVDRISESRIDDIEAFAAANMDFDTFLRANMEYNRLYNEDLSATEKATALARWINNNEFNSEQKAVIEEAFKYYSMMPAKPGRYDDFTEAGLDDEASYKLASALADLEPLEGKTSVSELQKCRAVIDTLGSPGDQMKALESVMNKSSYKKCVTAGSYGVDAETYVTFREALEAGDKDGNGSITQAEAEVAIDKMSGNLSDGERWLIELTGGSMPGVAYLTNTQRAVLWQLANPSWNPKNNPYSESVGRAIQELFK